MSASKPTRIPDFTKHHSARFGPVCAHWGDGLFWIRIFGKGFHVRDTDRNPLRFSEREGYRQMWTFRWLR